MIKAIKFYLLSSRFKSGVNIDIISVMMYY